MTPKEDAHQRRTGDIKHGKSIEYVISIKSR